MSAFQKAFLMIVLVACQMSVALTKNRRVAQTNDGSVYEVILSYEKDANSFRKLKLHLTTNSPYMSFESFNNQEYILDCPNPNSEPNWTCFSPCEGGSLKVVFSKTTGFKEIEIPPFQIIPRLCDGTESEDDQELTSRKSLKFSLKGIEPQLPRTKK